MGSSNVSTAFTYIGMAGIAIGAILAAPFTGGASIAGYVALAGAVFTVAGALTAPGARSRSLSNSRHYGIGDFSNPVDTDTPAPLLYGTSKVIPQILQEHVAALAEGAGTGTPAVKRQGISILCAVAEGQVSEITDVRLNEQAVISDSETVSVGTGNAAKKSWTLPARWIYLPSLTVQVDGTEKAQVTTASTIFPVLPANSNAIVFTRNKGEKILTDTIKVYLNDVEESRSGTFGWTVRRITKKKVRVTFRTRPAATAKIKITFSYLGPSDMTVLQNGKGFTTIAFGTAPGSGAKVTATYRRAAFRGLFVETRPGTLDQEPIPGFGDVRNSYTIGQELTQNTDRDYTTSGRKVNDLRVGIVAPRGFIAFSDSGGVDTIRANVVISYAFTDASGNVQGKWRTLYHLTNADNAKADYILAGQSTGPRTWEIGVRDTLLGLVQNGYTEIDSVDLEDDLATLAEGAAMKIRVTRKDRVRTDPNSIDGINFQYATEVGDQLFSYPGTALLAIRAIATDELQGGAPLVTCKATRADLYDPRTGLWNGRSDNPALAAYDLITSGHGTAIQRYGGRGWFTAADIDSTTLNAWANYCDEYVHNDQSNKSAAASATNGERRHSLNLVLDTPMSLNETVADIAFVGGAFAAMQGVKWRFPLDKTGTASFAFTESASPSTANIVEGSFEMGPEPLENTPTDLEVQFYDRTRDYQAETVMASRADLAETTPRRMQRVTARGVDRATEAERLAVRLLQHAVNNPVPVTWLAHPGALTPEAGDIVSVTTYVPGGTAATGWAARTVRIVGMSREWPADGRPPLVRYEARVLSEKPYAVVATATATKAPGSDSSSGFKESPAPGTSGGPVGTGGTFQTGTTGASAAGISVVGFKAKVLP